MYFKSQVSHDIFITALVLLHMALRDDVMNFPSETCLGMLIMSIAQKVLGMLTETSVTLAQLRVTNVNYSFNTKLLS